MIYILFSCFFQRYWHMLAICVPSSWADGYFLRFHLGRSFPAARCCGPMQAELLHTLAELFCVANLSSDLAVRDTHEDSYGVS